MIQERSEKSPFIHSDSLPSSSSLRSSQTGTLPPPPSSIELNIRTMSEDLKRMGQSAASARNFEFAPPIPVPISSSGGGFEKKNNYLIWGTVAASSAVILFLIGYFALPLIFPREKTNLPEQNIPNSNQGGELPDSVPVSGISFSHKSFFRRPTVSFIPISEGSLVGPEAKDLKELIELGGNENVIQEMIFTTLEDQAMSWNKFVSLSFVNPGPPPDFWEARFEADFTAFVFKENNGLFPGYVLKLKSGQSPLALQSALFSLEKAEALNTFYLDPPGELKGTFEDVQIGGQPVRKGEFESGKAFIYGWVYNQYLLFSTSENGFKEALMKI